ncbi:unnamed protein product [Closterium sp. NIES-53]
MDDARQYALYVDVDYSADESVCSHVRSLGCLPPVCVDLCLSSLGACVSALGACVASEPGTPPAEASLTSLVFPRSSTTLPCPVVPSGVLRGLHIPSFTRNLVGVGYLQDRGITATFVGGGRTGVCTDAATGAVLATFTREPRSGLYVLHTERSPVASFAHVTASPPVPVSSLVFVSSQVVVSGQVAASCSCRSLAHPTVLWHHRLGHPSLPRFHSMASHSLVSSLPRVFLSLPPSLAPPCTPCVAGRLRATLHSSFLRPATAPFETLHLDIWGPAPTLGPERERYFLVVVNDYSSPKKKKKYTSADKLSARAISCVFLGFPVGSPDYFFYHPPLHQFLDSRDVRFDKAVSYYTRYPVEVSRCVSRYPSTLGRASGSASLPAVLLTVPSAAFGTSTIGYYGLGWCWSWRYCHWQYSICGPRSRGVGVGGAGTGGASSGGAGAGGAGTGGANSGGAGAGGPGSGGASSRGTGAGGIGAGCASFGGAGAGGAGAVGASTEETGAGGSPTAAPTAPPHHHDTCFQALRRLEREEQEQLEQERQELQHSPPHCSPPVCVLPSPPESSLTVSSHPITDYYRAACPVVSHVLASLVTDPRASSSSVSALTVAVPDFASTRHLDYATRVVAAPPPCPLSVGSESAFGWDVLEDMQFKLEFLAAASSSLWAMLLSWKADMDAELASWRSTGTYVDADPPPRANVVDGTWLFKVKRPTLNPKLQHYLGLQITRDRAARTITLTQSHMVQQVLRRFGFQFSTTQPTPLAVDHQLTGPFSDEPFESSGPYAELVGCLIYLMTRTRPNLAFPLSVISLALLRLGDTVLFT